MNSDAIVNDAANIHHGEQNIIISQDNQMIKIPLEYDGYIMKISLRCPTQEEKDTLSVLWLTPTMNRNS